MDNLVSERLLPAVTKPAQYVGLEANARRKDPRSAELSVAMAFPDAYAIGISHLGSQVLYALLNSLDGVACDRTYCPHPDAERVMRERGVPLFAWESRCAVRDFDVLGFSLAYELCATNVLTMLDLAGVPLHAADRGDGDPLVVGGDALADSPEPLADFLDAFLPGDGERTLPPFVELVRQMKRDGASREDVLLAAAKTLPHVYAPRFYEPTGGDGLAVPRPARDDVPNVIDRAHIDTLSESPVLTAPLVPVAEGVHERVVIEIMRGCPNGCRFCQAGHTRLPVRMRSVEEIVAAAIAGVEATGFDEVSLLSLSSSDYPKLDELIERLSAELTPRRVSISLPSLRVGTQLKHLPKLTSEVRKGGLTIAPEAGSERLRRALRKNITEDDMFAGVRAAYEAGWRKVKLYFMAGLPGETNADIEAIADLCRRLSAAGKDIVGQPGAINASVSWFVPKPHTPMQWCAAAEPERLLEIRRRLRDLSRRSAVNFRFHWVERSLLEAVIARGDRRIGEVIEAAWRAGARMDAWNEHFDYARWQAAFEQTGLDPESLSCRELPLDTPLPWSHIRCRRGVEQLRTEHEQMRDALGQP